MKKLLKEDQLVVFVSLQTALENFPVYIEQSNERLKCIHWAVYALLIGFNSQTFNTLLRQGENQLCTLLTFNNAFFFGHSHFDKGACKKLTSVAVLIRWFKFQNRLAIPPQLFFTTQWKMWRPYEKTLQLKFKNYRPNADQRYRNSITRGLKRTWNASILIPSYKSQFFHNSTGQRKNMKQIAFLIMTYKIFLQDLVRRVKLKCCHFHRQHLEKERHELITRNTCFSPSRQSHTLKGRNARVSRLSIYFHEMFTDPGFSRSSIWLFLPFDDFLQTS